MNKNKSHNTTKHNENPKYYQGTIALHSYLHYIIGESFYGMSMPGYLGQYHNALWVSLASGAAITPFWWAYSDKMVKLTPVVQLPQTLI